MHSYAWTLRAHERIKFHYVKQYYPFYLVEYITHNSYELGHVDELKHIELY